MCRGTASTPELVHGKFVASNPYSGRMGENARTPSASAGAPGFGAETGLTAEEVAERVSAGQTNAFTAASSRGVASILRENVLTLFNGIVVGCFTVLLILGYWQDALFGFAAIANAVIGSVQEFRAKRALDRLAVLHAPKARVLREGRELDLPPSEIVIDDVLVLRAGDQVTADAVVAESRGLQLDESMLTGESDPVEKVEGDELLSGSGTASGRGLARVVRVGADSFANQFASEARQFSLVNSELRSSINRVLRLISYLIGPVALLVINAQVQVHGGWEHAILENGWRLAAVSAIAAIVSMIPLGLVLMTSIAFVVGAVRLSRHNVLVQELAAVEGLARVDTVCLDKTGTLTEGRIVFEAAYPVPEAEDLGEWETVLAWFGAQPDANSTARCLAEAFHDVPTDSAHATIEFSSQRKWSAVSFDSGSASGTWVMGGPEMIFGRAGNEAIFDRVAELASEGRRVLVLGYASEPFSESDPKSPALPEHLVPVTLLAFGEQIRDDAAETISFFASQGVRVMVVSGDNPATVAAVAHEIGIACGEEGVDARGLPEDGDELAEILQIHSVFGRVSPQQKRQFVLALQAKGHTVAMTGDGVNDALAVKAADIGIAMNSGAPATKAVSRLVLLDGRFSHLPKVVHEGRQVIANIERVSMIFLTKTTYITVMAIVFGALVMAFPFLPRQLSMTDGLTLGIPAFFLALLPNSPRYRGGFLRRALRFALPAGISIAVTVLVVNLAGRALGVEVAEMRTASTLVIGITGLWVLLALSRPLTWPRALIVVAMGVGMTFCFTVPVAREFFQLATLSGPLMIWATAASAIAVVVIEGVRLAHARWVRRSVG